MSATGVLPPTTAAPVRPAARSSGVWSVYRAERRKLSSQLAIRLLALVCLLGPFVFAAILKVQSGSPADTLYGVWVHSSGVAVSLVLLAFAGTWGFPLIAGIVAGDVFSSEDRYGTWKLVLTRSCTRRDLYVGKLLAAATFTVGLALLAAVSSLVAGVIFVGAHSLVSLSGTVFSGGHAFLLALASWLICIPPTLAFMSLAVLLSIATRNGIMGVIGPGIAALVMGLLLLVGTGIWAHMLLVASAFNSWHGLFNAHPYFGQLIVAMSVSVLWTVACLDVSWGLLHKRDFAGTPVSRRPGWGRPVRVVAALAAAVALIAVAGSWGPAGVTAFRLQHDFIPNFKNLTVLQIEERGHHVPRGETLPVALPSCKRRGSTPNGPGEWICSLQIVGPSTGALPSQPTTVAYDVSVQWDGCYKAQSPPAFIGQQTMPIPGGRSVVNPLYTVYGCFNTL
jgi:ABC-2 type transport system permease protein